MRSMHPRSSTAPRFESPRRSAAVPPSRPLFRRAVSAGPASTNRSRAKVAPPTPVASARARCRLAAKPARTHGSYPYRVHLVLAAIAGAAPILDLSFAGSFLARAPRAKRFEHVRMREKRIAQLSQHRSVHDATHVCALRHFLGGDVNLEAMPVGIRDGRAKDDAVQLGP